MLLPEDLKQIKERGSSIEQIENQLQSFQKGFPFIKLVRPATANDGIKIITSAGEKKLFNDYDEFTKTLKVIKFVPASGAASRMFKDLFTFKEKYSSTSKINDKELAFGFNFFNSIKKFAFYNDLKLVMQNAGFTIENELENKNYSLILDYFLTEKGLNYANLPKAFLKFHLYSNVSRTAIEEHFVEGAEYGKSGDGNVYLHFTVSPEHVLKFEEITNIIKPLYEEKYNTKFIVSHSIQQPSTDTIAVDIKNNPFREKDNKLLFRPAGHGSLIWNLNKLNADLIFIKNIDNIVPDRLRETTILYKKIIGALLINIQKQAHKYLTILSKNTIDDTHVNDICTFIEHELEYSVLKEIEKMDNKQKCDYLFNFLNRPVRVCGMVKNEGEPGGGPFWVTNSSNISLQIVESSQINFSDEKQENIVSQSTHFNPVDIVCGIKDFTGKNFDLNRFIDNETGFISVKSKDGKELKAMEVPGLWNGAMANWITIFVEVPIITFNPVKTVNDLLRSEHQNSKK